MAVKMRKNRTVPRYVVTDLFESCATGDEDNLRRIISVAEFDVSRRPLASSLLKKQSVSGAQFRRPWPIIKISTFAIKFSGFMKVYLRITAPFTV